MEEVKKFIETFTSEEAEILTLQNKIDVEPFNKALPGYNVYFVEALKWGLGIEMSPRDEDELMVLGDIESFPPCIPRHLFKISQYGSDKYGDVWIAYMSRKKPSADYKALSEALFIIKEKGKCLIAREYSYSDYESDGKFYQWEARKGYQDLTFESLGEPVKVERIQEPIDKFDGLELYNGNI